MAPKKSVAKPTPELEPPTFTAIALVKVSGGFAVVTLEVQGSRVLKQRVHTERADSREYACKVFDAVAMRRCLYPDRQRVLYLEDDRT